MIKCPNGIEDAKSFFGKKVKVDDYGYVWESTIIGCKSEPYMDDRIGFIINGNNIPSEKDGRGWDMYATTNKDKIISEEFKDVKYGWIILNTNLTVIE